MKKTIYEKYGKLAMYDKGLDGLARHWVVGYQVSRIQSGKPMQCTEMRTMKSIKGRGTVQKVTLYVEGTEWTKRCPVLDNLAAMIDAEDAEIPDAEGWAVVEKPISGVGFKHYRA